MYNIHYCSIHKETFLFLRSIMQDRNYKQKTRKFLSILQFVNKQKIFTREDLMKQFSISYHTVGKYFDLFDKLKLYRLRKRTVKEIELNTPKQYVFVIQPYLKEIIMFIKHDFVCPIFLTKDDEIFQNK